MYLTYDEYLNMGGTLEEATFVNLEFEARTKVDYYTFNRLNKDTTYSEAVKRCVYKIIELIQLKAQAMSSGNESSVASQSNDGFSVTFNTLNAQQALEASTNEILNTINMYLSFSENEAGKRLLYRGRYPDE